VSLLEACNRLGTTWIGTAIRESQWGFALIEMVHLLALALLGGALLVTGLRVGGFLFKEERPSATTRDLGWLVLASFVAMLVSGTLLFASGPTRYYDNAAFRVKLVLIASAVMTALLTHLIGIRGKPAESRRRAMKAIAFLSLTLWLGAAIAGRVIGVL
jgi:hypothetical protein